MAGATRRCAIEQWNEHAGGRRTCRPLRQFCGLTAQHVEASLLHAAVAVVHEAGEVGAAAVSDRHLQGVGDEVGLQRAGHPQPTMRGANTSITTPRRRSPTRWPRTLTQLWRVPARSSHGLRPLSERWSLHGTRGRFSRRDGRSQGLAEVCDTAREFPSRCSPWRSRPVDGGAACPFSHRSSMTPLSGRARTRAAGKAVPVVPTQLQRLADQRFAHARRESRRCDTASSTWYPGLMNLGVCLRAQRS